MARKVTTLFEDSAKTNALYPRTKVSAISDGSGTGLDALLSNIDAEKQDTLTVGSGISISSNTISAKLPTPDFSNVIADYGDSNTKDFTLSEDAFIKFSFDMNHLTSFEIDGVSFAQSSTMARAMSGCSAFFKKGTHFSWKGASSYPVYAYIVGVKY